MLIRCVFAWLAMLGIVSVTGCQKNASEKPYPLSGEVTLDGAPMTTGEVIFESAGNVPRLFVVNNGQFSGEAPPGQYVVRINSYVTGKLMVEPSGPGAETAEPPRENIVDPQFNTASKLTVEVKAGTANKFTFAASKRR